MDGMLDWIAHLFPWLQFVWIFLVPVFFRWARWMGLVHAISLMGFSLYMWTQGVAENPITVVMSQWDRFRGIQIIYDSTSITFTATAGLLLMCVLLYSWKRYSKWTFFFLLQLTVLTVVSVFMTMDLFNAYVCMELFSLVVYLLISYSQTRRQVWAGLKYMILSATALNLFLVGAAIIYSHCGTLNLTLLCQQDSVPRLGLALILGATLLKTGVFLFSMWLPNAHGEADAPVSALLSGLVVKAGFVFVFRLVNAIPEPWMIELIVNLGWVSALFGGIMAFMQTDIKYLLAFSTMSQMGFILSGIHSAGISYAVNHAALKCLWFLLAGTIHHQLGTRDLRAMKKSDRPVSPLILIIALIGFLTVCGIPYFGNTLAKETIIYGLPQPIPVFLYVSSALTVAYFSKIIFALFNGKRSIFKKNRPAPSFESMALIPLIALLGVMGIYHQCAWTSPLLPMGAGILLYLLLSNRMALGYRGSWFRLSRIMQFYIILITSIAVIGFFR